MTGEFINQQIQVNNGCQVTCLDRLSRSNTNSSKPTVATLIVEVGWTPTSAVMKEMWMKVITPWATEAKNIGVVYREYVTLSSQNMYQRSEILLKIGTGNVKICLSEAPKKLQSTL